MAIGTDAAIQFFGTQDTVTSSSSLVANDAFSVSGDVTTWTNDDDAPQAAVVFEGTYSVAPDASSLVLLYARLLNVQGTNDPDAPDANFLHTFLGAFPLNDVTTAQYSSIVVDLPNTKTSQEYEFYILNQGGQSLSAGWDLYVTPVTVGPHG